MSAGRVEQFLTLTKNKHHKAVIKELRVLLNEIFKTGDWDEIREIVELDIKLEATGLGKHFYYTTLALQDNRFEIFEKLWSYRTTFRYREKEELLRTAIRNNLDQQFVSFLKTQIDPYDVLEIALFENQANLAREFRTLTRPIDWAKDQLLTLKVRVKDPDHWKLLFEFGLPK